MKCRRNPDGLWETELPGDPQELPKGYQSSPCENCCTVVPDHFRSNCPHPEFCNFGLRFAIKRVKGYITRIRASQRSYLNGNTDQDELCPVCNWFVMRDVEGVVTYHNPEECLKNCQVILKEHCDQWEIKFDGEDGPLPLGLCTGKEHTHESWQEYEQCYADIQGKCTLHRELHALREAKNELCQVCVDIFTDHAEAQCPVGPGFENQSLLHFWDNPIGSFVRFIGTIVEHVKGVQTDPCPVCNVQEDQHNYAICL